MPIFPADIFTEPANVDPDTLANLGPLRPLADSRPPGSRQAAFLSA